MELKEKLVELRRQKGLTQDELARALGVTRQAVSKWERGIIAPATMNLAALGRLYGVPLDELVNGELQCEEPPATAVAVAEKPEAGEKRGKPGPLKIVGTVVLAGCILVTMIASAITIGSVMFKDPETPKENIVQMGDMEQEDIGAFGVGTLIQEPFNSID